MRLVSIIEAYVDSMNSQLVRRHLSDDTPTPVRRMTADVEIRSSSTWGDRKEAYARYHGVSIGNCSGWNEVDAAIAVRNSLAHGLGTLTPRQRNHAMRTKMRSVGARVVDDRIHLTSDALGKLLSVAVAFVDSVDSAVRPS
jgi:hypothetical protein